MAKFYLVCQQCNYHWLKLPEFRPEMCPLCHSRRYWMPELPPSRRMGKWTYMRYNRQLEVLSRLPTAPQPPESTQDTSHPLPDIAPE